MNSDAYGPGGGRSPQTLAQKIDRLMQSATPVGGEPPSYAEIARAIDEAAGARVISPSYIWKLHNGKVTNPRLRHLEALAGFFQVPTGYFVDESVAPRVSEQLDLLDALKTGEVRELALRASDLSAESLRALNEMVGHFHDIERKSSPPDSPGLL